MPNRAYLLLLATMSALLLGLPTGFALLLFFQSRDIRFWLVFFPVIFGGATLLMLWLRTRAPRAAAASRLKTWGITAAAVIVLIALDAMVVMGVIDKSGCSQTWQDASDILATTELVPGLGVSGDGKGPYVARVDGVKTYMHHLLTVATIPEFSRKTAVRSLTVDLSNPVAGSGAVALSAPAQATALKTYWYKDANEVIHAVGTIPIDTSVVSDRTDILLTIDGRLHRLTMGPWASSYCDAEPGMNGAGTTPVTITRSGETNYAVTAPPGSIARLWDISDSSGPFGVKDPVDKGLYHIGLEAQYRAK